VDGNLAGELRAEVEEVYSNHLLYNGDQCLMLARGLTGRLRNSNYRWVQAQAWLEKANCEYLVGDFGSARVSLARGN